MRVAEAYLTNGASRIWGADDQVEARLDGKVDAAILAEDWPRTTLRPKTATGAAPAGPGPGLASTSVPFRPFCRLWGWLRAMVVDL